MSNRDRTQRDLDIIKQSSLKAAVDLAIGILPTLETGDELSDLVLRIADKFNNYILDGRNEVERTVNEVRRELEEPEPESELERAQRHVEQLRDAERQSQRHSRQSGRETEGDDIHTQFEMVKRDLSRQPNSWRKMTDRELEGWDGGRWIQRGKLTWGASSGDLYPISAKQYGFMMGLCEENGLDPDPRFLNGLSTHGASLMLDCLQELRGNGNGKKDRRR